MQTSYQAIIIGAGIIGASTAYHLSKAGLKNVVVVDTYQSAGLATKASAAMVMHQTGDETTTLLAKLSIKKYEQFYDEIGVDIGFHRTGSMLISSTKEGKEKLTQMTAMQNRLSVPTEMLTGKQVTKASGIIQSDRVICGSYVQADGYINAVLATRGYLKRAKELGVDCLENTQVVNLIRNQNKIIGIETKNKGKIYADLVINCAGMYASDVGKMIDINIPIKSSKKNMIIIKTKNQLKENLSIIEDYDHAWYLKPHEDVLMVGLGFGEWTEDNDREITPAFDESKITQLEAYLSEFAPQLVPFKIVKKWVGYRPMINPKYHDVLPILGYTDGIEGYFNNCGWGEFGVTHGAIAGELAAQIITNKKTVIDTSPFLLSRFKRY